MLLVVQCYVHLLLPGHRCCSCHLSSIQFLRLVHLFLYLQLVGSLVKFHYGEFMYQNATLLSTAGSQLLQTSLGSFRHTIRGSHPSVGLCLLPILQILRSYWLLGVLMGGELGMQVSFFSFTSLLVPCIFYI